MKSVVKIFCWAKSHATELVLNRVKEEKLARDAPKMKQVCPHCKPLNSEITIVYGQTILNPSKPYECEDGHLNLVSLLGDKIDVEHRNYQFHAKFESLDEAVCVVCQAKLIALDDTELSKPNIPGIKTRTRVGDIWDKQKVEPVRAGQYDKDGYYKEDDSAKRNKERLRAMRKRNISEDRLPGTPIDKPTDRRK